MQQDETKKKDKLNRAINKLRVVQHFINNSEYEINEDIKIGLDAIFDESISEIQGALAP